jgi:hypothetical protein
MDLSQIELRTVRATKSRRLLRYRLALAQEAAEQLALALAGDQLDVADEFCAALAALQHDLAAVERLQLDTMRKIDDGLSAARP